MSPISTPNIIDVSAGDLMQFVFYGLLGLYALFTAMLYYHWQTYAANARVEFLTIVIYFVITIPLLLTLGAVVITT